MDGRRIESVEISRRRCRWGTVAVLALAVSLWAWAGCASTPDSDEVQEADDDVVGAPPEAESDDYEFALPPQHPGAHGDVRRGASGEVDAPIADDPDVIDRRAIEELRRFGPSAVMRHVRTEPAYDDGGFVGFELVDASSTALRYVEPKLELGDVITHVNLVRLEKPDDYMEAWETLEHADEIRIDVIRDGDQQELIWRIE